MPFCKTSSSLRYGAVMKPKKQLTFGVKRVNKRLADWKCVYSFKRLHREFRFVWDWKIPTALPQAYCLRTPSFHVVVWCAYFSEFSKFLPCFEIFPLTFGGRCRYDLSSVQLWWLGRSKNAFLTCWFLLPMKKFILKCTWSHWKKGSIFLSV